MEKLGNFICKNKWLIVIISFILLIPSAIGYFATRVNYDILVYLPSDIETLKGEHILTDDFHMGAFSITIVENMANQDLIKLENDFRKIKGVTNVISINDLTGTSIPVEVLPKEIKDKVAKGNTKLVLITFENSTSDDVTLNAVDEMRKIADERVKIGGMSAMVLDTKELFNSQMLLYIVVAVICCIFILEISLDSYLVPILLILNIGIAIIYNMGTNIFLGEICYITKAIAAVLQLGVTTDFSIFLYHKYEAAKEKEKNNDKAMSKAIKETITSVLGSSLTTIAGFLALCTMQLTLGADIGIVMAKGVLLGLICVIILFPALLLVFDKQIEKTKHKNLLPEFKHIKSFATKHYITIFVIFIILLVPSFIAQKKTPVYYKLDTSIPENYGYTQATKALQENYNMMSQSMILVDKTVPNYKINEMVKELKEVKGINAVISASTLSELGIPEIAIPENLRNIYQTDKYTMVIISSIYDIATDELNEQLDIVNDIVDKYDETAIVAGEGPLTKDLVTVTDIDLKNVNYTSIAVIFVIMLLILKSISLPILLVSAIEFAIFINIGIPYVTNSPIPFVASIVIGTIQLGATIDYAILLTTKYLEERKNKKDKMAAVKSALDSSTTSIIVSGMCFFAATFGVGVVSTIDMIGCLCTLMARGAIISMAVVIFVLPSILIIFDKIITKTTLGFKKGRI
ncbi:MAG: MMPL family transporter [Bacilli bacterium]|nr:MMPL family transporter [Bacilli bacterium]